MASRSSQTLALNVNARLSNPQVFKSIQQDTLIQQDTQGEGKTIEDFQFISPRVNVLDVVTTQNQTFLLDCCGKVYYWGKQSKPDNKKEQNSKDKDKDKSDGQDVQLIQDFQNPIVCLVAGNNHVLALDSQGCVYAWGRNDFGQLGLSKESMTEKKEKDKSGKIDKNYQQSPKEIDFLRKENIIQLYAGGDSSYAVSSKGSLYAWGDNRNGQLCMSGQFQDEPKLITTTPWENSTDIRIVYGKDNVGTYFIPTITNLYNQEKNDFKQDGELARLIKVLRYQVKELTDKNEQLTKENQETNQKIYGDGQKDLPKDKEEGILNDLSQHLEQLAVEKVNLTTQKTQLDAQILKVDKQLESLKEQLIEISRKEGDLINKKVTMENEIRKKQREKKDDKQIEELQRQLKTYKDLLEANENIKNSVIKRQNESEEMKAQRIEENRKLEQQLEDVNRKERLYKTIYNEKKSQVKVKFMENHKLDLDKLIQKAHSLQKSLNETNINLVSKKSKDSRGIEDLIKESNNQILKIKNDLKIFKFAPSDPSQDIMVKVIDMIEDNINIRLKMNHLTEGLLIQTSQQYQKTVSGFQKDIETGEEDQRIIQRVINQKNNLFSSKTTETLMQSYGEKPPKNEQKKGLFCF